MGVGPWKAVIVYEGSDNYEYGGIWTLARTMYIMHIRLYTGRQ